MFKKKAKIAGKFVGTSINSVYTRCGVNDPIISIVVSFYMVPFWVSSREGVTVPSSVF